MPRPAKRNLPARVEEARIEGRTTRTLARWDAAQAIAPALFAAAGAVGVAWQLAGEATAINATLGITISITIPAGLIKIFWDRSQKRRMRARMTELEEDNRNLVVENAELRGEMTALRRSSRVQEP